MKRHALCLTLLLIVVIFVPSTAKVAFAEEDSYFVGRLLGTVQPLPKFFQTSTQLMTQRDYPEFRFFRIVNTQSGKKININPLRSNGYFGKSVGPGTWILERNRKDSTGDGRGKVIEIMTFEVPKGSLINLGTLQIVLDGEPKETLKQGVSSTEGEYIYTYSYMRAEGAEASIWPVDNLKNKKSKVYDRYQGNIVDVKEPLTAETDNSKIILRTRVRESGY